MKKAVIWVSRICSETSLTWCMVRRGETVMGTIVAIDLLNLGL